MPNRTVSPVQIEVAADEEPFVDFIEAHFDSDFYLRIHVDVAKAGIDAAEHFFTHGIGENRRFSPYVDMHHGVDASLSLDRTWKTFRWRGNPIAVRLVSGQGHDVPAADGGRRSFFARFGRAFGRRRLPVIAQVGNPFESVGRSEHIRTIWRALRAASVRATIYDVYGQVPDGSVFAEMGHCRVDWVADGIRIFHLNGAEMQYALPKIEERQPGFLRRGYNVLAPAWELPRFPAEWAKEFNRFHEIWAPTAYVQEALQRAVSVPIFRLRNACEPHVATHLDKSYFGIPEDSFAILNFFDLRSRTARKNPWAVIEAFRRLLKARPASNACLVLKINYPAFDPKVVAKLAGEVAPLRHRAILIDKIITTNEIRNLVRCCDCFISLHRSEGFGRGPAEAMFFGKPTIATGWSGNMEYMNDKVAFPIRYTLQPVKEGEYPQHEDQVWAEADVAHAAEVLIWLLDDPALRRKIGERGRIHMELQYSDKIVGASYRRRIEAILDGPGRTFRNINR